MADEHLISLQPGTVIAGRYEVVKCLGAGSMGLVYACRHRELSGHLVAVKVLFPEVSQDKIAAARFRNEIFASYGVSHPNVVRAYEYIRDGDLVAYTMEYVGGGDLADRLGRSREPIAVGEVIKMLSQMCAGVQAIHDSGIVHRDLKPENILLSKDGNVKIADFGIARTGHGPKLTEHGGVVGTIDYVSPEYMLNSQVDWRSDIYALGILAYEMLTGESPFKGDSVYATMTKRLKTDPEPPSRIRQDCPPELDAIVLKAMQRDPESRYQSAGSMYEDLQALAEKTGTGIVRYDDGSSRQESVPRPKRKSREVALPVRGSSQKAVPEEAPVPEKTVETAAPQKPAPAQRESSRRWDPFALPDRDSQRSSAPAEKRQPQVSAVNSPGANKGAAGGPRKVVDEEYEMSSKPTAFFSPERGAGKSVRREAPQHSEPDTESPDNAESSRVFATAVDTDRMKKLHQLVEEPAPWDLYDFLRLVLAILIGLGVGFLIVHRISTDILGIQSSTHEEVNSQRNNG